MRLVDEVVAFLPAGTLAQSSADLHLSYSQAGLLLALGPAGGSVGTLFTIAADHVSRRLLASLGAAGAGAAMLMFGLSPMFAGVGAAAFFWGMSVDAMVSGAEVALVDVSGEHLTPALGRQNFLGAVGDLVSPAVVAAAGFLRVGWRALFVGAALMLCGYSWWLASEPLPRPERSSSVREAAGGVLDVLRDRRVWLLAAAEALISVVDEPFLGFVILFLERVRGVPLEVAALVAMANLVGAALGSHLAPSVLRRRPGLTLTAAGGVMAAGIATLVLSPLVPLQFAAAFTSGVVEATIWVAIQARVLSLRPGQPGATSAVVGWIGLVQVPFPLLVGAVADRYGLLLATALYGVVALALAALMPAVAAATPGTGRRNG